MPMQQIRPVSTYDNLGSQQSRHLESGMYEPELQPDLEPETELNTSHSIAAVKAALNDAKSKFFGINNYESPAVNKSAVQVLPVVKPEPKYQNVPQRDEKPEITASEPPSIPSGDLTIIGGPNRALRYATTYEQIPLSDLEPPQASQAVYMSTTVPQNMKGMKIAGRHTPTRNSLRHSRMIVVNHKNNDTLQETYIRNLNISRQLLIMQLAVGVLIVGLAAWILILAPNASILINPYLSGLSLLLASVAGLFLLRRDHKIEHRPRNNCYKVLLAESYVFTGLALVFCCLALVCAAIEFAELNRSNANGECFPTSSSLLNYHNCTCFLAEEVENGNIASDNQIASELSEESSQNDGCAVLRIEWKYLLAVSMALNTLGIVATFLYITLFICCHRNRELFYTSV
ncbi:uncharacterized protein LOC108097621 [Drosophila ficusphila]|uniref:uncharacterized protein LOC108097621 n=1 Tax=Drosophila ficusphila TaxID=30025 RepID=UPI0007E85DE5|nr:uncharacterized protein LOC108097621 [Drosophila ficusphila]XP_017055522.1 uncharacterized protein LOC108097621 [Drosophila ficusphila]XP_017055523.1 uncharacterized protein LOC108097621 [Drosophila ficusphila]